MSEPIVHIDSAEVREGVLDHQVERCPKCEGELMEGFGLAGGGFGPYGFCDKCQRVIYKITLPDDFA